jgi:glutathione S-transferase
MKLYLAPGACSSPTTSRCTRPASSSTEFGSILRRRTESGDDFAAINPKGYVPALVLDDGQLLTENVAILCWVAEQAPKLAPAGERGRIRLIEMQASRRDRAAQAVHPRPLSNQRCRGGGRPQDDRQAVPFPRREARGALPVRQRMQRRRRLSLRDAALGADEGAGCARAAPALYRADRGAACRAAGVCGTKACPEAS